MIGRYTHAIFDFDGTLVDSAPAILECFREVLTVRDIAPHVEIDSRLIGPPLLQTLALISGLSDVAIINALAGDFKSRYDSVVAQRTPLYPGIREALARLSAAGCRLHVATNKRTQPTQLILEQLGLTACFDTVYAIDLTDPPYAGKAAMIAAQIEEWGLLPRQTCYIGDKPEDGQAADANALDFFAVDWGYGEWNDAAIPAHWRLLSSPVQLR